MHRHHFSTVVSACSILLAAGPLFAQDPPDNAALVGHWDGYSGSYGDLWPEGDFVYLGHFGDAAVHIIDISDPANPVMAAEFVVPAPNGGSAQDVKVHDGVMFVSLEANSGGDDVLLVDVRDATNPVQFGAIRLDDIGTPHNSFFADGFLYVVDSNSPKIGIVDLTGLDPDIPPLGTITTPKWVLTNVGTSIVHDITVQGGRLYACAWDSGLWVYDVSNVADEIPNFLGSAPGNNTHSCWPTSDGHFVVTGEERTNGGIKVFEITDFSIVLSFTMTDSLALTGQANSVHNQFIQGNRLYNGWYQAGLQVFDIDPVTGLLEFVASYDTHPSSGGGFAGAWSAFAPDIPDRIVVSDMQTGLYVIAIGDCDGDGVPDDVELALEDCNGNGIADDCDRASYGDVDGNETVDLDDLICLLEALSGLEACQPAESGDLDIFPCETGDGDLNLHDLLNLLDALGGSPACPASCS